MQVNYFGHMELLRILRPTLEASAPSRVVVLSSIMHRLVTAADLRAHLLSR